MPDLSNTASGTSSANTLSQKDLVGDTTKRSLDDGSSKEISNPRKNVADGSETASRKDDNSIEKPGDNSLADLGDRGNETQKPWTDLEDYMIRGKPPEHNAEGLVTLWNAQYDTGPEPATYMATDFDIVIVHGIGGTRRPPWKNPGAGNSIWLYDQGHYGGRRVMSFGYNLSKIMCGIYTYQAIKNMAACLLEDLISARDESTKERSIMFVAHDIGGVVVKCALTLAGLNSRRYGNIFDSSRVLLFYGCPHRAADNLEMEARLSKFVYGHTFPEGPTFPPLVKSMRHLAEAIMSINALFIDSKHMPQSYILSMYSDDDSSLIDKVFDEFTGTLGLPFEIHLAGGLKDDQSQIEKSFDRISPLIKVDKSLLNDERLLLSIACPLLPLRTTTSPAHPYAWIAENGVYKSWYNQQKSQLLYLTGETNTRLALEYVLYDIDNRQHGNNHIILYFTFNGYDIRYHNIGNMLTTFITQMPGHFRLEPNRFRSNEACRIWSHADLFAWFDICRHSCGKKVFCIINGFDECEPVSRKAFLDRFHYVSDTKERPWRVMVTSHKPGALLKELSNWPILDIDSSVPAINNEVILNSFNISLLRQRPEVRFCELQLEEEIKAVAVLEPEIRELVLNHVSRNERWPLQESIKNILGPVEEMSLESAVEKILNNIPDQKLAFTALSWILHAVRPLTSWELMAAIIIGLKRSNPEETLPTAQLANQPLAKLQTWLAGIITLEHNEIFISTHRIREVLLAKSCFGPRNSDTRNILSREAHSKIARTCLAYLTRPMMKESLGAFYEDSLYNGSHLVITDDRTTLQNYAVRFWMHHISLASTDRDLEDALASFSKSDAVPYWSKAYWALANPFTRSRQPFESLYSALAGMGLTEWIENWSCKDEDLRKGLIEACSNGALGTVRLLLPRMKYSDESLTEALISAGANGDEAILSELIKYVAENHPSFPWEDQSTLIPVVSWLGLNTTLVKLLEAGCPVDTEVPETSLTPLQYAIRRNNVGGAKLLLERRANPNHVNTSNSTSLHIASFYGYTEIIRLLARYGADLNAQSDTHSTPLHYACLTGLPKAVEVLVELNASLDLEGFKKQDMPGWRPLAVAIQENNVECVRILLEANVDPDISIPDYGTPLACAVSNGCLEACKLLFDKGANPNHESITPPILFWAMNPEEDIYRVDIIKLLIKEEARLNAKDANENTAFYFACWLDGPHQLPIVEYLLEQGANVNQRMDQSSSGRLKANN
ncbi:hypothetical protein F4781DRAFT_413906 [Annulohypoxylon bovei var. microspora]|nr:hypothetical protein F4781DRAFT_413906 [Annulohypoxylon bovei var. microspora]